MTNLTHKFKVLQTAQLIPSIARPAASGHSITRLPEVGRRLHHASRAEAKFMSGWLRRATSRLRRLGFLNTESAVTKIAITVHATTRAKNRPNDADDVQDS